MRKCILRLNEKKKKTPARTNESNDVSLSNVSNFIAFQMLSFMAPCPKFLKEYDKLFDDAEVQKFHAQYKSMFEYIKNHSHLEMGENAFKSTTILNDVLSVEVMNACLINCNLCDETSALFSGQFHFAKFSRANFSGSRYMST